LGTSGCEELKSRRQIQKGNKLYASGDYLEAIAEFEAALERSPDLDIGHYNAGLAYLKMFKAGVETKENIAYANGVTDHFSKYLEKNVDDAVVVGLMTRVWMDSGQYEKALEYWRGELAKNEKDTEVLLILASINRQAGNWEKAVEWHYKEAEVHEAPESKVKAYLDIAKLAWHKLIKKDKVSGMERLRIADTAIAALQKAQGLAPKNHEVQTYLVSMYDFRALIHGVSWAQAVDKASMLYHRNQREALKPKAPKKPAGTKAADGS
jgi:tetratricopeptide (TPR) repeat protein